MVDKSEWCIVKYHNKDGKTSLLVRMKYQWDAQTLRGDWEYLADGFKSNEEALFYLPLYND